MTYTVGIAAITGKLALCIAKALLKRPDVNIRGYCRTPSKLPPSLLNSTQVSVTQGGHDDVDAVRSFAKGCDVVICCYLSEDSNVMIEGQKMLIDVCEQEGVGRYIASDYTMDYRNLKAGQYTKKSPMIQVKEYLDTKSIHGIHILNEMFMETFFSDLHFFWDPTETKIRYYGSGEEIWEITSYNTTAQYVAAVALDPQAVGFFKFLGDRKSTHEIISIFESVYGTKPATERLGSLDDLWAEANKEGEQDFVKAGTWFIMTGQVHLGEASDAKRYPHVKPDTLRDFFTTHEMENLRTAVNSLGQD
ncbi:NAD(P)-binding protein [Cadophora sp. DSE1049]|nr:NAD(P)-binding protein [Cadophora sp. DSE1049]